LRWHPMEASVVAALAEDSAEGAPVASDEVASVASSRTLEPADIPCSDEGGFYLNEVLPSPRRPPPDFSIFTKTERQVQAARKHKELMALCAKGLQDEPEIDPEPWEPGGIGTLSEEKPNPAFSIHFDTKWKAKGVRFSPDETTATWRNASFGGFAVSAQPLKKKHCGRWYEVRIEEANASRWSDGLGIGVCHHPSKDKTLSKDIMGNYEPVEGLACENLTSSWLMGYDGRAQICSFSRYLKGDELPKGMWKPSALRQGDVVGVLVTQDGHLLLFVNEELVYLVPGCNIPWNKDLFACIDLDGSTQTVHLLDTNGFPSQKVLQGVARIREDEFRAKDAVNT